MKRTGIRAIFVTAIIASASPTIAGPLDSWRDRGWSVLFEASGDLNRDGAADYAAIIEAPKGENTPDNACDGTDDYSEAETRRLVIAFADQDGGLKVVANEPRSVLRHDQGGVFGDPLEGLAIERGAVVVTHYGGSRWRWGDTLRFRHDDDEWRLIGMTEFWLDSAFGNVVEYDYNPLSGKMSRTVEIVEEQEGEPVCVACRLGEHCPERDGCYEGNRRAAAGTEWFDIGRKPPIALADFQCWREQTGLLRHLGFEDGR